MRTTVYLHSMKETMLEKGEVLGLDGAALDLFMYACAEVKLTLDVDVWSGDSRIVAVDDRPVKE